MPTYYLACMHACIAKGVAGLCNARVLAHAVHTSKASSAVYGSGTAHANSWRRPGTDCVRASVLWSWQGTDRVLCAHAGAESAEFLIKEHAQVREREMAGGKDKGASMLQQA